MNKPIKVTKKPVGVEAMQFTSLSKGALICNWAHDNGGVIRQYRGPGAEDFLVVETLEAKLYANMTDWIIRGVNGEFYPCNDEIFKKTYTGWEQT